MKIFLEDKKTQIENPDLEKGKLVPDKIKIKVDEVPYIAEKGHYEVVKEYPNGGKDVKKVIDVEGQEYQPAKEYNEEIYIYKPYTAEELKEIKLNNLRARRETECFPIINRGRLWYDSLTSEQTQELNTWYQAWLDVTETLEIPQKPIWIK